MKNKHYERGYELAWSPKRRDLDFYLNQYDAKNDDAGAAAFEYGWLDAINTH